MEKFAFVVRTPQHIPGWVGRDSAVASIVARRSRSQTFKFGEELIGERLS